MIEGLSFRACCVYDAQLEWSGASSMPTPLRRPGMSKVRHVNFRILGLPPLISAKKCLSLHNSSKNQLARLAWLNKLIILCSTIRTNPDFQALENPRPQNLLGSFLTSDRCVHKLVHCRLPKDGDNTC